MANLYVGSDGIIHRRTGNGVNGAVSVNTNSARATRSQAMNSNNSYGSFYESTSYVSKGRKVLFWIFSIVAGIFIGVEIYNLVGAAIFATYEAESATEAVENWFWNLAPWIFAIGGCIGSVVYGLIYAKDRNYDLCSFILSALSSVAGIAALALALAAICFVVMIIMHILAFLFGIFIICIIIGAVFNS